MPGETIRLVDGQGVIRDVPVEAAASALDAGWTVPTHTAELDRVASQAREAEYGGAANAAKATLAGVGRGLTLGGTDVLGRALGGEDTAIALEGLRDENAGLSIGGEIAGALLPIVVSGGTYAPAALATAAGRGAARAAGAGLRGAIVGGATEGAIFGAGTGVSELALSRDPLTAERAASVIGSNVLFGGATGGALAGAGNLVERGLVKARNVLDAKIAERAARDAVPDDLAALDPKGLRLAEESEHARIETERVGQRQAIADDLGTYHKEQRDQKLWLATQQADEAGEAAGKAGSAPDAPVSEPVPPAPEPAPSVGFDPVTDDEFEAWRTAFKSGLSEDDKYYVRNYIGEAHRHLNETLRKGKSTSADTREALDRLLDQNPAPRNMRVYRGLSGERSKGLYSKLEPGDQFVDRGFSSTSQQFDEARRGTVTLEIDVPSGYPAATIGGQSGESEILLRRDSMFEIVSSKTTPDGELIIHARVVPDAPLRDPAAPSITDVPNATVEIRRRSSLPKGTVDGFDLDAKSDGQTVFNANPERRTGAPGFDDISRANHRDVAYTVRPSELAGLELRGIRSGDDMLTDSRTLGIRDAWKRGERVPPVEIDVTDTGHYFIADGNHRVVAAALDGDRPIVARFRPVESDVAGMDRIGDDVRAALGPTGSPASAPAPPPLPKIEGLAALGKRTLVADRALDRLLDNPKMFARKPRATLEAALTHLEKQEAAWEGILAKSDQLRAAYATDATGQRLAALEAIPAAIERNRAIQARITDVLSAPSSPRLAAIGDAREALKLPKPEPGILQKVASGAAFGTATGVIGAIPVVGQIPGLAHLLGARVADTVTGLVFGRMGKATGEVATRTRAAVDAFTRATQAANKYVPVIATKTLGAVRYGLERDQKDDDKPKTPALPELFKARTDEIKQLTEYDETGTPRMRPRARQEMAKLFKPVAVVDPVAADRLETIAARRIEYLSSKIPRRPDFGVPQIGPDTWQPSDMEMRAFARTVAAVEDPHGVEERAIHGGLTPEDVEAYWAVHPERAQDFKQQIMLGLSSGKVASLPYERKLALSMLVGEPVDPSLHPRVLGVLQGQFPNEPGTTGGSQAPRAQPQFGSIKKSVQNTRTPAQERAQ